MSNAGQIEKTEAKTRKVPVISTTDFKIDQLNTITKSAIVTAPADMTAQDCNDPTIWRNIQASQALALVRFDRVLVVGDGWAVDALVSDADASAATLAFSRVLTLRSRSGSSWVSADGAWSIRFAGTGFGVFRDDGVMAAPSTFRDLDTAKSWLQSKYGPIRGAA
jgi:hypothetical protein